ncbi:MAG: tetratricopeptide repeat protein [Pyrinomonadaceae bacterium]|nr:tetratricopeptide repeat protein [Pyrinomonadaceae bacterium]
MSNRIEVFENMIAADPDNTMVLFGLANEYLKDGNNEKGIETLLNYLEKGDDEGAAYGMLATAYEETGETEKARAALERGIGISLSHGHPTMAGEYRERLENF